MNVLALVTALCLAPAATMSQTVNIGTACALPAKTLTYKCGSACAPSVPCWYNTTTAASESACAYTCMTSLVNDTLSFVFLVPYGKWKSPQELASPVPLRALVANDDTKYTSVNNDYLEAIDTLEFTNTTKGVYVDARAVRRAANASERD